MILSLTSKSLTRGQMYDAASTVLAQRISQIEGVGNVNVGGGALPAVRVALDLPTVAPPGVAGRSARSNRQQQRQPALGVVEAATGSGRLVPTIRPRRQRNICRWW